MQAELKLRAAEGVILKLIEKNGDLVINDLWYKNAIIYCLSVGTYMDANGDGVGDLLG